MEEPIRRWTPILGAGLMLAALTASCSVERHYRILSFFFDGVPDPNQPPAAVEAAPLTYEERLALLGQRVEVPDLSSHPPVEEGLCQKCHYSSPRQAAQGRPATSWLGAVPRLLVPVEELCGRCHTPPQGSYVHGPAGALQCQLCHVAHRSPNPHLVRHERVEQTCRICHRGDVFVTEERHRAIADRDCIDCHDPHGGDDPVFLKTDGTDVSLDDGDPPTHDD